MKYGFFPGCVLEGASKEDYLATVAVAKKLGIEIQELDGWTCCGASHVQDIDPLLTLSTNARNIALAEKEGLDILLHKKELIKDVSVSIIGEIIDISLLDFREKEINKDTFSKGEQQMYATVLLKGLVDESNISFPVFIDSPMQKFDIDHSNSIVKYFYPKISDQVIIFPLLKKEMTENEYNLLLPNISKAYLIKNEKNESSFQPVEHKEELFTIFEKEYQNANEF